MSSKNLQVCRSLRDRDTAGPGPHLEDGQCVGCYRCRTTSSNVLQGLWIFTFSRPLLQKLHCFFELCRDLDTAQNRVQWTQAGPECVTVATFQEMLCLLSNETQVLTPETSTESLHSQTSNICSWPLTFLCQNRLCCAAVTNTSKPVELEEQTFVSCSHWVPTVSWLAFAWRSYLKIAHKIIYLRVVRGLFGKR